MSTMWRGRSLSKPKRSSGGAEEERAAGDLDRLEPGVAAGRRAREHGVEAGRGAEPGELDRLQHRLVVLLLVLEDHLVDLRGTAAVEHLERALADLRQVGQRLAAVEQGEVAADGPGRLEGVVHRGQLRVQQRLAAVAVDEPQVLVGRDVAEVPHQRAHQRGMRGLDIDVRQRGDEVERALARLFEGAGCERGDGHGTRVPEP